MPRPDIEKVPQYYKGYVEVIQEDAELLPLLIESRDEFVALIEGIPEEKETFSYAPEKWTVKELIAHICDAERVFSYRALRFGRGDMTDLPGFEQDDYVTSSRANARPLADMRTEFINIRNATIDLFNGFGEKEFQRFGSANGLRVDVNSLGYIMIGHQYHHMSILQTKYLK